MKKSFLTKIKPIVIFLQKHKVVLYMLIALAVNFVIECLSRHSGIDAIVHLFTRPLVFLYNSAIIFMTLSFALLFKRSHFVAALLSVLWMTLGVINCILLFFRTTPLSLIDFFIVQNALTMMPIYMGFFETFFLVFWIVVVIWFMVYVWKKCSKIRMSLKKSVPIVCSSVVVVVLSSTLAVSIASKNDSFAILTKAYDNWGFVHCFARTLIDSGIEKPDEYSQKNVESALSLINRAVDKKEKELPNVVVIQLESFFDVSYMKDYVCSEDPIPTFNWVKKNGPSGLLTVPSLGGGTANTEFEVLTGICLDIFGIGEYPYQTVLKETPCESMARTFKDKGYVSSAIHNHTAIFYKRNQAYASLGFDKFASVETMNVEKNELGWSKDAVLIDEITQAMETTPEKDFVFTVTVQGHGKYPEEEIAYENKVISADGFNMEDPAEVSFKHGFEYYVNQLRQTDNVVKQLIEYFENYPEPVALVLYGDHLPAFNITNDNLNGITMYQTEYCMWTNYMELEKVREDIFAYQLNALVFEKLGLNPGMFPKVTQVLQDNKHYKDILSLLAYDMLYGKNYASEEPPQKTDMKIGINPIKITGLEIREKTALIHGGKFTKYSTVFVDGESVDTVFVSPNTLKVDLKSLKNEGCTINVSTLNHYSDLLAESEPYTVEAF